MRALKITFLVAGAVLVFGLGWSVGDHAGYRWARDFDARWYAHCVCR